MATAATDIADDIEDDSPQPFEIEPSMLDDQTHAETLSLYRDAGDNIRFAKGLQWKTLGGTLAMFALLVVACYAGNPEEMFAKTCIVLSVIIAAGSIYSISILQSWQNTEREKIELTLRWFSNVFVRVYGTKSRVEANFHRYILIAFMAISIVIANYLTIVLLMKIYQS